jgi:hypothetical protein
VREQVSECNRESLVRKLRNVRANVIVERELIVVQQLEYRHRGNGLRDGPKVVNAGSRRRHAVLDVDNADS